MMFQESEYQKIQHVVVQLQNVKLNRIFLFYILIAVNFILEFFSEPLIKSGFAGFFQQ